MIAPLRKLETEVPRIMLLGVNPFEDVPGFQLLGLFRSIDTDFVLAADDSAQAVEILSRLGASVVHVPHPRHGICDYARAVEAICEQHRIDLLLPATDAHLVGLALGMQRGAINGDRCPHLQLICDRGLFTKWAIQDLLAGLGPTPRKWKFTDEADLAVWEKTNSYPVMVKGLRKGGVKCQDYHEVLSARRCLLDNPANQGELGGTYMEEFIEGEEHSILLVKGKGTDLIACIGIRKLATTKLGTTLMAIVEDVSQSDLDLKRIASVFQGPGVIEIESRMDSNGCRWLFEANLRFPSWIGSLGAYGVDVVSRFVSAITGKTLPHRRFTPPPQYGSVIYRLPASGVLSLPQAFGLSATCRSAPTVEGRSACGSMRELWVGCTPHEFRIK